jgi:hypothetical protein
MEVNLLKPPAQQTMEETKVVDVKADHPMFDCPIVKYLYTYRFNNPDHPFHIRMSASTYIASCTEQILDVLTNQLEEEHPDGLVMEDYLFWAENMVLKPLGVGTWAFGWQFKSDFVLVGTSEEVEKFNPQ